MRRFGLAVILLSVLLSSFNANASTAVPAEFVGLNSQLANNLSSFNTALGSPSPYPVLYTGNLTTANGNSGADRKSVV